MTSWMIFIIGSLILTLLLAGDALWLKHKHRKHALNADVQALSQDIRLLIFLIWLALLSILAYVAFAFGQR